jgi:hypothetical protein
MQSYYPYRQVDHSFFSEANLRTSNSIVIKCQPKDVTETLSGDDIWTRWAAALEKIEWTTPRPFAEGSRRTVHLVGKQVVREIFFHWEEDQRISFYVEEGTLANIEAFAEDYIIEPIDDQHTRLTWKMAIELTGVAGLFAPVLSVVIKMVLKGWLKKYKSILETPACEIPQA